MRRLFFISLLFVWGRVMAAEPDTAALRRAVYELNMALERKDTMQLHQLLHHKLGYGHSNGWVETKQEVIDHLFSGKLAYNKIEQGELEVVNEGRTALVRSTIGIDVALDGRPLQMKLLVLQVWIWEPEGWRLIGRQSTKM